MTEQNWFSKAMQDFTLTRRSFVKWSAALGGAVAVSGGARSLLKSGKITGIAEAADNNLYGAEKIVPVICGCGDVCGMYHMGQAYVKEGKIVYYEGCKEAENKGALCARGMSAMQVINHPDRVKYPMKRLNAKGEIGEFERISWDEAYDTIAEKMAAAMKNEGPQTVGTSVGHIMDFGVTMPLLTALKVCLIPIPPEGRMVAGMTFPWVDGIRWETITMPMSKIFIIPN